MEETHPPDVQMGTFLKWEPRMPTLFQSRNANLTSFAKDTWYGVLLKFGKNNWISVGNLERQESKATCLLLLVCRSNTAKASDVEMRKRETKVEQVRVVMFDVWGPVQDSFGAFDNQPIVSLHHLAAVVGFSSCSLAFLFLFSSIAEIVHSGFGARLGRLP